MGYIEVGWEEDTCNNKVDDLVGFCHGVCFFLFAEESVALSEGAQILHDLSEKILFCFSNLNGIKWQDSQGISMKRKKKREKRKKKLS